MLPRPRVILLNHTDPDHPGCRLTCAQLIRCIGHHGELVTTYPTPRHEPDNTMDVDLAGVDVVLINGEGTMHHHSRDDPRPAAAELHRHARRAKEAGCRVALINTVFEAFDDDLSVYDYISTREGRSHAAASALHPRVDVTPDACFGHVVPSLPEQRSGVVVADSILPDAKDALRAFAKHEGHRYLRFRGLRPEAALRAIAGAELLITGRYHGLVFALMTRTPVLCLSSNTHKIEGLLGDFGADRDSKLFPVITAEDLALRAKDGRDARPTWEGFVSDRPLPPVADAVARMVRRAVLGDAWQDDPSPPSDAAPTVQNATAWEAARRRARRLLFARRRRHMVKFPSGFLADLPAHPGYRRIVWRGETVGRVRPWRPADSNSAADAVAFILASGPSINDVDLRPILAHTCIAVNGSIVKFHELKHVPDYYIVSDRSFARDRFTLLEQALASGARCCLPSEILLEVCKRNPAVLDGATIHLTDPIGTRYGHDLIEDDRLLDTLRDDPTYHLDVQRKVVFSTDPAKGLFLSKTVVYPALQVARFAGASRVGILGMDLSAGTYRPRFYEARADAAPMRLDEHYQNHLLPAFEAVRDWGTRLGFEVLNLSPTSRLPAEVLPKMMLDDALARWR